MAASMWLFFAAAAAAARCAAACGTPGCFTGSRLAAAAAALPGAPFPFGGTRPSAAADGALAGIAPPCASRRPPGPYRAALRACLCSCSFRMFPSSCSLCSLSALRRSLSRCTSTDSTRFGSGGASCAAGADGAALGGAGAAAGGAAAGAFAAGAGESPAAAR